MSKRLTSRIEDLARRIGAGSFRSEAEISRGVVTPVFHDLGWPVFDVQIVAPEFRIGTRKVDYALCHPPGKPAVLVEVKDLGKADGRGERQLFEYCFHEGVPIAVLTDGRTWSFFFPAGQGSYKERRFAQVDLVEDPYNTSTEILARYLAIADVRSGEARKRAQDDYESARFQQQAASKYASVWRKLLSGPEPLLLDLFLEEVKGVTGVRPDPARAADFIREQARTYASKPKPRPPAKRAKVSPKPRTTTTGDMPFLTFRGEAETFKSGTDAFSAVFAKLASMDPEFCRRYSEQHRGSKRRYVARSKELLYPGAPHLEGQSRALPGGWWLATHCSNAGKVKRVKKACELAGVEFGRDLIVHIPTGSRQGG
ncbi:hypothetical protein [Candidatus Palauibacter sp.]|uniref:hypothetical protein n=1 Tax=Candidatus Palauibacter sp. TaxID=3101350 RepID=UPI003B023366